VKENRPVFVGSDTGVRLGVSTRKTVVAVGEPIILSLWIDNQSDRTVMSGGRCPPVRHFGDVFDKSGRRLIGVQERATLDSEKKGVAMVDVCASTEVLVEVPAHTCMPPVDSLGDNITLDHKLKPGVSYVLPTRGTDPLLFKQGLMITVREP